jgi:hypothetical protein
MGDAYMLSQARATWDICLTFPRDPEPLVDRGYLLDAVEEYLQYDIDLVTLEGPLGIGKTIFLAQLASTTPLR